MVSQGALAIAVISMAAGALAAETPAEATLKDLGLTRQGSIYVLPAEAEVRKKLGSVQLIDSQRNKYRKSAAMMDPARHRAMIQDLNERINHLNAEIKELNRQLAKLPRDRWGRPVNNVVGAQIAAGRAIRDQYERERDQHVLLRDNMVNRPPDPAVKRQLDKDIKSLRTKYEEAIHELVQLVESTQKQYESLSKDPAVTKALTTLGRATRMRPTLGPSPDFVANGKRVANLHKAITATRTMAP
jgi:hypothetical protein